MWQVYLHALFFALASSGMAFVIAKLVIVIGERLIEKRHGTVGLRDMLVRRARLEQRFEARRDQRRKEIKEVESQTGEVARRRAVLNRQINDALHDRERISHLIGEEVKGTPCFHAQVLNKYVGSAAQHRNAFIDPVWAQPQHLEIWAVSLAEARGLIEGRYPPSFGYRIVSLREIGAQPAEPQVAPGRAA